MNEKEICLEMVVETTAEKFFCSIVLLMFYSIYIFFCSVKKCHFIYIDTWYIALTFVSVSEGKSSFIVFYISRRRRRSSVFHLFSFTTMSSHILLQFIYKYITTAHVIIVQLMNTHNATTPQLLLLRLNFSLIAQQIVHILEKKGKGSPFLLSFLILCVILLLLLFYELRRKSYCWTSGAIFV